MKQFRLRHILRSTELGGMSSAQQQWHKLFPPVDDVFDAAAYASWGEFFATMENTCVELELIASLATVRKIQNLLATSNTSHSALRPLQIELQERLVDEMSGKFYWTLNVRETELYSHPRKGWEEIIERFPNAVTDIEEASKCFALSRYAAAVFHNLQVVEIGLIDLGRVIVATDPQTGWNATTNKLKKILATKYPDRTSFQQQHSQFLEQISATIEALKSAWRNKISHAQDKLVLLTSDFTPEVAEEIMFASRGFVRRLAIDAPTSPDPDA